MKKYNVKVHMMHASAEIHLSRVRTYLEEKKVRIDGLIGTKFTARFEQRGDVEAFVGFMDGLEEGKAFIFYDTHHGKRKLEDLSGML